ncbi:WAS/WASL-interacting protein family member 3-like [Hyaena hyaena]|uniref:WAS/WASL-interacting protein family member 3-like n=1 Tax=Hyaena hyaena TaxID=95912 RepID=UPI00192414E1|nr:WAS/WASL-interacting protein family member 3-like [Hyaena hyaena]
MGLTFSRKISGLTNLKGSAALGKRAASHRAPSRPLLSQPHGARASPSGGAAAALGLPAEAHLLSFAPRTEIPELQCDRRSLRFLQTPRRTLPPLPPPALGLQQPCGHWSARPGVLTGRDLRQAGIRTPGIPGGAVRRPPEPPQNRLPLPPAAGASEPVPASREASGETLPTLLSARERPPGRPRQLRRAEWAPSQALAPRSLPGRPRRGARPAGGPGVPAAPPRVPHLARAPGSPSRRRLAAHRMAGTENLAFSASDLIFLYLATIILFPPDLSCSTASLSFVSLAPSVSVCPTS